MRQPSMSHEITGLFNVYHPNAKVVKYFEEIQKFEDEFGWIPSRPILGKEVNFEVSVKITSELIRVNLNGEADAGSKVLARIQERINKVQHPMVYDEYIKPSNGTEEKLTRWVNGHISDEVKGSSDVKAFSAASLEKSKELLPELRPITLDEDDGFDDFD